MTRRPTTKHRCASCGVDFASHAGVQVTCQKLQDARLLLLECNQWLPVGHELRRRIELAAR